MNTKISAKFSSMKRASADINSVWHRTTSSYKDIQAVLNELNSEIPGYDSIRKSLMKSVQELDKTCSAARKMSSNLNEITQMYITTEKSIDGLKSKINIHIGEAIASINTSTESWLNNYLKYILPWLIPGMFPWANFISTDQIIQWIKDWWKKHHDPIPTKVDSIVFDDEGTYGGDQGSPKDIKDPARREEIINKIEENIGRRLTKKEREIYLKRLNSEGCGYVALVNTIFVEYAGRPEEFERTFGFPMYYNGDLNYDMMIADIYSATDNRDANGNFDPFDDYNSLTDGPRDEYSYWTDERGTGTDPTDRANHLNNYMSDHGVSVKTDTDVKVTPNNFEKLTSEGKQVIVAFHDGDLLNMDGSVKQYIDGGHAMTVTGVTADGHLIVSSWGGEYMIDPKGTNADTWMTFMTVEYN